MRILHLVLTPRMSGAEILVRDLALYQQGCGEAVAVAALMPAHADFTPLRAQLAAAGVACSFPKQAQRPLARLWYLHGVMRRWRPDIVFAHATIPAFYARALPSRVPVVYVMHSAVNDFERDLFRWAERLLSRRARAVVGVAQSNVRDYLAAVGPHPRLTVIPNGVDTSRFAMPPAAPSGAAPLLLQIGRYDAVKNQLRTVRAFHAMLRQAPQARMALYGVIEDPVYYARVRALVAELGLGGMVSINGPCDNVPALLAQASVFAMPSASEAHSIAFLEALASGIPVVASDIPAFAFAGGHDCVQLVDCADIDAYAQALVRALGQPRARRPLEGLTLRDTARRYEAIAREVLGVA
ncbi:glycosyltransferase family 4 protein [Cupriavidus necator]|uniref:glycosyltransferase family 4 protein n=1 Tax=Cupriavidus necator TaxID=106590 RepID=UPI0005B4D344|nr:glycosyltransferase family 4 protein [Cupriavidus necator]